MEVLFTPAYKYFWAAILGLALFLPVQRVLFSVMLRRQTRHRDLETAEVTRLQRRSMVFSATLCLVFAVIYTNIMVPH